MVVAKIAAPDSTSSLQRWTLLQEAAQCRGVLVNTHTHQLSKFINSFKHGYVQDSYILVPFCSSVQKVINSSPRQVNVCLLCYLLRLLGLKKILKWTHQPSLSAALTLTPKSSRNLTMWWCPAHTALCKGVIPSSFGVLGFSTCQQPIVSLILEWNKELEIKSASKTSTPLPYKNVPHRWSAGQGQTRPRVRHPTAGPMGWISPWNHGLSSPSPVSLD